MSLNGGPAYKVGQHIARCLGLTDLHMLGLLANTMHVTKDDPDEKAHQLPLRRVQNAQADVVAAMLV